MEDFWILLEGGFTTLRSIYLLFVLLSMGLGLIVDIVVVT